MNMCIFSRESKNLLYRRKRTVLPGGYKPVKEKVLIEMLLFIEGYQLLYSVRGDLY